jgi:hypothetical protein
MPAAIVGACALVIALGFAFGLTAPSAPPAAPASTAPGSTPWAPEQMDTSDGSSADVTRTLVTRGAGVLLETSVLTGPGDSYAAILDPVTFPVVATDGAGILLAKPGVRKAVTRYLRTANRPKPEDVGIAIFPACDLATTVFVPYGAVAEDGSTNRFRLYGAVCQVNVVTWGAVPLLSGSSDRPVWLDIRTDGADPKVVAVHDLEQEWFDHSLGDDTEKIRAVPEWVMHRFPILDLEDEEGDISLTEASARPISARLALIWLPSRVPQSASIELPAGYDAGPHDHPGIGEHRQLSPSQVRLVFKPVKEADLIGFADESASDWVDFSGPDLQDGPVRLFQVVWNDPADYSGIVNQTTHRALRSPEQKGWWEFRDPVWTGDILTVDIALDENIGATPTILHCEIDWKTMKVLRAVPYGPLSPF